MTFRAGRLQMSKRAVHWRYFNKSRPPPAWLERLLRMSPADYPAERAARHRVEYYIRLWLATPLWADAQQIRAVYAEAHRRRQLGEDAEVDHIFPLNGHLVCGLHTHANLQVISGRMNQKKSARHYPGAPQLHLFWQSHPDPFHFELESTGNL
jgi:hypothetical protein